MQNIHWQKTDGRNGSVGQGRVKVGVVAMSKFWEKSGGAKKKDFFYLLQGVPTSLGYAKCNVL